MQRAKILDVSTDIVLLIIQYLSPNELLALCSTCHAFQDDREIRFSAAYWNYIIRSTFKFPNQPFVESDGERWMKLYRRMTTQSKIYMWGNCHRARQQGINYPLFSWPNEVFGTDKLGVVVDLQCGGWSAVALNSKGALYVTGMSKLSNEATPDSYYQMPLSYPPGYTRPEDRHDPSTAIRQFSAGEDHILGISDSGRIWSWSDHGVHGLHLKFMSFNHFEGNSPNHQEKRLGYVRSVKAGRTKSSGYVNGTGIIVWDFVDCRKIIEEAGDVADGVLIIDVKVIPKSAFLRSRRIGPYDNSLKHYGEVKNWVILESVILFVTDIGRVFFCPDIDLDAPPTEPIPIVVHPDLTQDLNAVDIQGSSKQFAIFLRNGAVLTGNQDNLLRYAAHYTLDDQELEDATLSKIACLQHNDVISISFGDHHCHAIHANGFITSYGEESNLCGALGLGGNGIEALRGVDIRDVEHGWTGVLLETCYTTGRRVHFEMEKLLWMEHLLDRAAVYREHDGRLIELPGNLNIRAEVSEWFERELRSWEDDDAVAGTSNTASTNGAAINRGPTSEDLLTVTQPQRAAESRSSESFEDDGLPTYFALSIASAGQHSAALVLVNEDRASKYKDRYLEDPTTPSRGWVWKDKRFPRLWLSGGEEMPGSVRFSEWECQPPKWRPMEKLLLGVPRTSRG